MDYIIDVWNQITGSGIVEPAMIAYAMFFLIFIVMPILLGYGVIKVTLWILETIRDWWHEGDK